MSASSRGPESFVPGQEFEPWAATDLSPIESVVQTNYTTRVLLFQHLIQSCAIHVFLYHHEEYCTNQREKGERGRVPGKGEGPWDNLQKVQLLQICRGAGVSPSRVRRDEDRI